MEALLDGMRAAVPFNRHVGLQYVSAEPGRCVVRLPDDERLRNHVGSQHAAGLFAAGEAASGGAFMTSFAEHLASLRPLVTRAEIEYTKLARGPITAEAVLGTSLEEIERDLEADGRAAFPVNVKLSDESGNQVAGMVVRWHLRRT